MADPQPTVDDVILADAAQPEPQPASDPVPVPGLEMIIDDVATPSDPVTDASATAQLVPVDGTEPLVNNTVDEKATVLNNTVDGNGTLANIAIDQNGTLANNTNLSVNPKQLEQQQPQEEKQQQQSQQPDNPQPLQQMVEQAQQPHSPQLSPFCPNQQEASTPVAAPLSDPPNPLVVSSPLVVPPDFPLKQLSLALLTSSEKPPFDVVTEESILSPDPQLLLHVYQLVLQIPALKQRAATLQQRTEQVEQSFTDLQKTNAGLEQQADHLKQNIVQLELQNATAKQGTVSLEQRISQLEQDARQLSTKEALLSDNLQVERKKNAQLEQSLEEQKTLLINVGQEKEKLSGQLVSFQTQLGMAQTGFDNEKREYDSAKQERARIEAELSSANSQVAALKTEAEAERNAKELIQAEKDRLNAELTGVSAQLSALQSSTDSGVRQTAEIRGQLEQVELEKRDILGSLQRERQESTRKAEEVDDLLKRNRESRQQVSQLNVAIQEAKSAENVAKFKLQGLQNELQLTKKDAEWAHSQLIISHESSASFRSAKRVEINSLQADLDASRQESAAARNKIASLQSAFDDTSSRLSQSSDDRAELQIKLVAQQDSFRSEINAQQQLTKLLERRAEAATSRINELEEQWEAVLDQCRFREEAAWKETDKEAQLRHKLEIQVEELSQALDRLAEGVGINTAHAEQHPTNHGANDDIASEAEFDLSIGGVFSTPRNYSRGSNSVLAIGLSPTADLASRVKKSGKTFSQVYIELAKTQEELRREKLETVRLGGILAEVMSELQDRAPQLQAQREETEKLTRDLDEMVKQTATLSEERDEYKAEADSIKLQLERVERENGFMSQQLADLGRQVRHLVKTIIIQQDPNAAVRLQDDGTLLEELNTIAPLAETVDESDTQAVITAELVTFRSLSELCAQNARLLQVTRQLGVKMEDEERNYKAKLAQDQNEAVDEARVLIVRLEAEIRSERARSHGIGKERDMFRHLCVTGGRGFADETINASQSVAPASNLASIADYEALKNRFENLKKESQFEITRYQEEVQSLQNEMSRANVDAARELASRVSMEEKLATLYRSFEIQKADLDELNRRCQGLQESLTRKDITTQNIEEQLIESRSTAERLRVQVAGLQAEKDLWKSTETKLLEENRAIQVERGNLQELIRSTHSLQAELESRGRQDKLRLEQGIVDELHEVIKYLRKEKETVDHQMEINKQETVKLKQAADQASVRIEELEAQLQTADTGEKLKIVEHQRDEALQKVEEIKKQLAEEQKTSEALQTELAANKASEQTVQQQTETLQKVDQLQNQVEEQQKHIEAAKVEAQTHRQNFEKLREQVRMRISQERKSVMESQEKVNSLIKEKEDIVEKHAEEVKPLETTIAALTEERDKLNVDLEAIQLQLAEVQEQLQAQAQAQAQAQTQMQMQTLTSAPAVSAADSPAQPVSEADIPSTPLDAAKQQEAINLALQEAQKKWDEEKAQLEADKAKAEEMRDKHLQNGKAFLRNQRAAEAQLAAMQESIQALEAKETELKTQQQEIEARINAAVEAKEKEVRAQQEEAVKAKFEAGKNEANLRNQLIIKQRDNKIAKLVAELAELKGEAPATTSPSSVATPMAPAGTASTALANVAAISPPTGPSGGSAAVNRPSVFGHGGGPGSRGRGGAPNIPKRPATDTAFMATENATAAFASGGQPTPMTGAAGTFPAPVTASIRGAAAGATRGGRGGAAARGGATGRGGGRGGFQAAGAKRKLSLTVAGNQPGGQAESLQNGDNAQKKPRPAGAPVPLKRPGAPTAAAATSSVTAVTSGDVPNNNGSGGSGGGGGDGASGVSQPAPEGGYLSWD